MTSVVTLLSSECPPCWPPSQLPCLSPGRQPSPPSLHLTLGAVEALLGYLKKLSRPAGCPLQSCSYHKRAFFWDTLYIDEKSCFFGGGIVIFCEERLRQYWHQNVKCSQNLLIVNQRYNPRPWLPTLQNSTSEKCPIILATGERWHNADPHCQLGSQKCSILSQLNINYQKKQHFVMWLMICFQ